MTAAAPLVARRLQTAELFGDPSYPTGDGRPMSESDYHRRIMFDLIEALVTFYAKQPVYVSGNLLLFYEPGNKRRHVSPDVLVTKGLTPGDRLNYILWQEKKPPDVVFEITSRTTRHEDLKQKFLIYQDKIKVAEYFLFDPLGDYLNPRLQGYRLQAGKYVAIRPTRGRLVSKQLRLILQPEERSLRLIDQRTGEPLLSPQEEVRRLRQELTRLRHKKQSET